MFSSFYLLLSRFGLSWEVDLSWDGLRWVKFSGVNFVWLELSWVVLIRAGFSQAVLSWINLVWVYFSWFELRLFLIGLISVDWGWADLSWFELGWSSRLIPVELGWFTFTWVGFIWCELSLIYLNRVKLTRVDFSGFGLFYLDRFGFVLIRAEFPGKSWSCCRIWQYWWHHLPGDRHICMFTTNTSSTFWLGSVLKIWSLTSCFDNISESTSLVLESAAIHILVQMFFFLLSYVRC